MGAYDSPTGIDTTPDAGPAEESVRLMREVRFSVDRDWAVAAHGAEGFEKALPVTNSWGGWPSAVGIAPYLVLRVIVSGRPDPVTGYLLSIQTLDKLLRNHAIPLTAQRLRAAGVGLTGESLVRGIWESLAGAAPDGCRMESLRLSTTPYLSYAIDAGDESMTSLTQCFEFSASHRLHVAALSDEENRQQFGKCNNPTGHGHNYRVEVTLCGAASGTTGVLLPLPEFEAVVQRAVIDRLDHKHLNTDVPAFREVNPSVENIARVIWSYLDGAFPAAMSHSVRVWETAKTYAEYAGGG